MVYQNKPILELQKVDKTFTREDGHRVKALKKVSLSLDQGKCVGIVGESGSGKSTLARVVSHLTPATDGNIFFQGKDITSLRGTALKDYYQKVQMIFQEPLGTFSPRMKIGDYLVEPFVNFSILAQKKARSYAKELLERVGLPESYVSRYPSMLSGGQLQRVVIARSIGLKPEIIICDECTSALDVTIQQQIMELFSELRKETGFASLFITHDLALAEGVCDEIHVMYDGQVVEQLAGKNITQEAKHPYTIELIDSVFSLDTLTSLA